MTLDDRLASGEVLVLDGGMSNALEEAGADLSDPLWTARVLRDEPHAVAAVHERYFRAGADVAITATYQAPLELLARGVQIAREVRDRVAPGALVAASLGPYGALLADGSEYRGRYGLTRAQLRDVHGPRLEALVAAGPDLVAAETVPDLDEAEALLELLADVGLPAWLSYSVAEGRTRAGQPLADAYAAVAATDVLPGVNCSAPGHVLAALEVATGPAVVYPNRGEDWDATHKRWSGGGAFDPALVRQWVAAGARLVGGCCRVGPDDVAAIAVVRDSLDQDTRQES